VSREICPWLCSTLNLLLGPDQRAFEILVGGKIAENEHHPTDCSIRLADWRAAVIDWQLAAVLADKESMIRKRGSRAVHQHPIHRVLQGTSRLLVDNAKDFCAGTSLGFACGPVGELLCHRIQKRDTPFDIRDDDCIADTRQRSCCELISAIVSRIESINFFPSSPRTISKAALTRPALTKSTVFRNPSILFPIRTCIPMPLAPQKSSR
jgi:hypothetical protein